MSKSGGALEREGAELDGFDTIDLVVLDPVRHGIQSHQVDRGVVVDEAVGIDVAEGRFRGPIRLVEQMGGV